jgi:hypothetical protein
MGLKISVDVGGLARLGELAKLNLAEAVEMEAQAVAAEARSRCPRSAIDTPGYLHLQDSIEAQKTGEFSAEVHDGKSYGVHVEYGAKGRQGVGMFTQAFQQGKERFPARVRAALEQAVKDASRG